MKVVPGLEMARKVPKIVFEIWGNFFVFLLYIHIHLMMLINIFDILQ